MSSPSIQSPKSTPRQWLSNDEQCGAPRGSSENVASGQLRSPEPALASTSSGDDNQTEHAPPMSYPIDENLFYSAPSQPLADALSAAAEQTLRQEPGAEEVHAPPDFKPFFTLIEDPETGEHHHPAVHYIFSDDDAEILTTAALEALQSHEGPPRHESGPDERHVIIDVSADGNTVVSGSSLSKDWQALQTLLAQAPSWGDESKKEDKGLMLKISGREQRRTGLGRERRRSLQAGAESIEGLVAAFSEKLDGLDEVLGRLEDADVEQHKDVE